MDNNNTKRNIGYTALVIVAILLLCIPFFLFDIGDSINGTNHLVRFGLHILAFAGAIFIGSAFVSGVTSSAASSAITMKVVAVSASAIVTSAVVYNVVQTKKYDYASLNAVGKKEMIIIPDSTNLAMIDSDSLSNNTTQDSLTALSTSSIEVDNITSKNDSALSDIKETTTNNTEKSIPVATKTDKKTTTTPNTKKATEEVNTLEENCQKFKLVHGTKLLDHKLGLSIYDPDKTFKFNNDCGCLVKDAPMVLFRENKKLEEKTQNGNFATLRTFKDVQVGDKVSIEIEKATCKNSKGLSFLYTFPKKLLINLIISDHREFETAAKTTTKKQPKELFDNSNTSTTPKDKVEEEMNKYGN